MKTKEAVVNSELILWKPVDIVAVRVISKAPWYCKAPIEPLLKTNTPTPEYSDNVQQFINKWTNLEDEYDRATK